MLNITFIGFYGSIKKYFHYFNCIRLRDVHPQMQCSLRKTVDANFYSTSLNGKKSVKGAHGSFLRSSSLLMMLIRQCEAVSPKKQQKENSRTHPLMIPQRVLVMYQ